MPSFEVDGHTLSSQAEVDAYNKLKISKNSLMQVVSSAANVITYLPGFNTMPHEKNNKLFFGCELELIAKANNYGGRLNAIEKLTPDLKKHAILKAEGCCGFGFEIVTVPATLDFHRQKLWGKFFTYAKDILQSANGCGLHIHFSRDALSPKQLAKVIYFVHEPANTPFLHKISDRQCLSAAKKTYFPGAEQNIIDLAQREGRTALHISQRNQGKTCEFRIFRSQHTEAGVMRCLEFTAALIEYCGIAPDNEKALGFTPFLNWFTEEQKGLSYPFLQSWLISLKYIKGKAKLLDLLTHRKKA